MQKRVLEHLAEESLIVLASSYCWTLEDLLLRSTCNVLTRSREEVFLVISFRNIAALSHMASLVLTAWDTVEHWLAGISSLRALCYSTISEDLGQLDTGMSSSVINRHFSHWKISSILLFSISLYSIPAILSLLVSKVVIPFSSSVQDVWCSFQLYIIWTVYYKYFSKLSCFVSYFSGIGNEFYFTCYYSSLPTLMAVKEEEQYCVGYNAGVHFFAMSFLYTQDNS